MPLRNVYLSILHGFVVGFGLILFSIGSKVLPAAQLTLLSMVEVVGGVLWVTIPIFGIHYRIGRDDAAAFGVDFVDGPQFCISRPGAGISYDCF
jgi:hypothetical protein